MARESLKYALKKVALEGISSDVTKKAYKRAITSFVSWAKENGIKRIEKVDERVIQTYCDYLKASPKEYSASTIHSKIAPICKAVNVSMDKIRKPKRISADNTRGRTGSRRSDLDIENPKYSRLIALQCAVGARRAELGDLVGSDLLEGAEGVLIRSGKGGKSTVQLILPEDREAVRAVFKGVEADQRVFSEAEMMNHLNLHGMRAAHAQKVYHHFEKMFEEDPSTRSVVIEDLIHRWDKAHQREFVKNRKVWTSHRKSFIDDMREEPYKLRGKNKTLAEKNNKPVAYDRLALMACSVYSLSHWRLNVTVANYMLYDGYTSK